MSGDGRVMADFNRRNGRFTRSDAVEKVLLVVGRGVKLDLAQFSGQVFALLPGGIRGVKSSTIYPHPAFGANPFHAHLDVGIAASQRGLEHRAQIPV